MSPLTYLINQIMKAISRAIYLLLLFISNALSAQTLTTKWTPLLKANLTNWDVFSGIPNDSLIKAGYPKDVAIGLYKDPLKIFTVEMQESKPVLHVSGELYGGLSTKDEYENYHFKTEFKWGEKRYGSRATQKRDNGILYHATGEHGKFALAWMASQEMQVQETDMGDYYGLSGVTMDIRASKREPNDKGDWFYNPKAPARAFSETNTPTNHCARIQNFEKPRGEWNTLEVICLGSKSIHVVNGHVVMVLENSRIWKDGKEVPLTKGKIQLQSELAECYYRNIQIRQIDKIPAEIAKQL
ncbi:MAG: DUF1080 domain-containing protein [Sphingobacteriaceae bacterium]|nr:MAG: DUF1080 domain-containing protein [Sphingobacteriaceae bacterium]